MTPRLPQLDLLRGIAIILMVVNHVGNKHQLVFPDALVSPINEGFIFIGSFAPVLFFFVTGFGYGLNYNKKKTENYWADAIFKAIVLVVVERLMLFNSGSPLLGLDFLSFIGIIILIMSAFRYFAISQKTIIVIIIFLFLLRYLIGPLVRDIESLPLFLHWLAGSQPTNNVSYPLSPWLIYPVIAYMLGMLINQHQLSLVSFLEKYNKQLLVTFVLLSLILVGKYLLNDSLILFRWGTVSLDFFILSLMFLLIVSVICAQMRSQRNVKLLSISGLPSLLVVPVHYYLLRQEIILHPDLPLVILMVFVTVLSIFLANFIASAIYKLNKLPSSFTVLVVLFVTTIVLSILSLNKEADHVTLLLLFMAQLFAASFFLIKPGR